NAVRIGTRTISTATPNPGQYVGWNNSTAQWEPMIAVTSVATGTGLLGGPIATTGTISIDVGLGANQILQLTTTAQAPGVDGNLLTNINAIKLQTRNVSSAAPTSNQVLRWNNSTTQWEPSNDTNGTVTNIATSTGILGGPISTSGTISIDVGTGANQIVQL